MDNKGFTLVEVLAVIAIIAVVSLIATPSILSLINTGKNSSYEAMIGNIRTAAEGLYQEMDYFDSNINVYDNNGKKNNLVIVEEYEDGNEIVVNIQTLVGNGFLAGVNNDDLSINKNKKIILEPKNNKDIGLCEILIKKVKRGNSKVCYKIVGDNTNEFCPTTKDFGGDNQCIN